MDEDNFLETDTEARANLVKLLLSDDETNWEIAFSILKGLEKTALKGWIQWHEERKKSARMFFLWHYATSEQLSSLHKEMRHLDFSKNELKTLPENIENLTKIFSINLNENIFTQFPEVIKYCTNLKELNISKNQIDTLPKDIENLKKLSILNISENNFIQFPEVLISSLNLTSLDISKTSLKFLPDNIQRLTKLRVLNISNTQIIDLPYKFRSCNINTLYYKNTPLQKRLTSIKKIFDYDRWIIKEDRFSLSLFKFIFKARGVRVIAFLKALNIEDDLIDIFGYTVFKQVLTLNLSDLHLTALPSSFIDFSNLRRLNLGENCIETLPIRDEIIDINLKSNHLTQLPEDIEKWKKLKKIDISTNNIQEIPIRCSQMVHLKELIWKENNLAKLPESIAHLSKLKILRLEHNQLEDIANIEHLQDLEQLYVNNNNLQDLPLSITHLKKLKILDVRKNPLSLKSLKLLKDSFPTTKILV